QDRLQEKAALSPEEKAKLTWAEAKIAEGRLHFAKFPHMRSTGGFANKVEETLANKRQRSTESASMDAPGSKRQRGPKEAGSPQKNRKSQQALPKKTAKVSEVTKRHLIVALIDSSDEARKITEAQWKMAHARLVESLYARLEDDPEAPMPTFDGAGWLNGVKILKCMADPTRKWLTQAVCQLEALWEGAKLEVVDRELIPSTPKAKVLFPIAIQADRALKLLQRQSPDIPTADWKVLHVAAPSPKEGGQSAVLQINKDAENILYPRYGKMAWGMGSVYLRLKKRHPGDKDAHPLKADVVEKNQGPETIVDADGEMTLEESDEGKDGDLTVVVNTSYGGEASTHDGQGAAAQPP
ncbi:hypothetical protein KR059_011159, partial [Drosophila kikkawai]